MGLDAATDIDSSVDLGIQMADWMLNESRGQNSQLVAIYISGAS